MKPLKFVPTSTYITWLDETKRESVDQDILQMKTNYANKETCERMILERIMNLTEHTCDIYRHTCGENPIIGYFGWCMHELLQHAYYM